MKRININKNQVGLVLKNNAVERILTTGKYWLWMGEKLAVYEMSGVVQMPFDMDLMLTIPGFAELVDVIEVPDMEIALHRINGNLYQVLGAGRYFFWKGLQKNSVEKYDISTLEIPTSIKRDLLEKSLLKSFVRMFTINPEEKGLLFVDGMFKQELLPGSYYFWKNSIQIEIKKVDMRIVQMDVPGQEILTKDKAQVRVNFIVQYQVEDIYKALLDNRDFNNQLYALMQFGLREYIGNFSLDGLMENREGISSYFFNNFQLKVEELGLKLFYVGIKDIILPGDVRDIMNQVLIAEKRAQANIITRREETASTRSLLNTAKLLEENNMLFRLKEMEYMEKISEKINNISVSGNGQVLDQLKQLFVK